jgi:hypothetical protein
MGGENERRRHKRLPVRMGILCKKVDSLHTQAFNGSTVDICPDGVLAENSQNTATDVGELFTIELDIPDIGGTEQFNSKVSAYARVIRIVDSERESGKKQVAFQFCTRPQFDF